MDVKEIGAYVLKGTDLYTACYYLKNFWWLVTPKSPENSGQIFVVALIYQ